MIFIERSAEPEILTNQGNTEALALCEQYKQGKRKFEFKSNIYGHESVKIALKLMQHDKCCFCESKVSHIDYGDVEHYRPKGGYQQNKTDTLSESGYYWLAYTWDNLLFCCAICNQQYKKNLFPLLDNSKRAINHYTNISQEHPMLINPSITNPENYISFREEVPYALNNNDYGKTTIKVVGLDRDNLNDVRLEQLNKLKPLINILNQAKAQPDNLELIKIAEEIKPLIKKMIQPSTPYSALFKAYLDSTIVGEL